MIFQMVNPTFHLWERALLKSVKERAPRFEAIRGLLRKYDEPETWGVYMWETPESLHSNRLSELAQRIPGASKVTETRKKELLDSKMVHGAKPLTWETGSIQKVGKRVPMSHPMENTFFQREHDPRQLRQCGYLLARCTTY